MRSSLKTACVSLTLAGLLLAGTAQMALAGFDEAHEYSFWTSQSNGGVAQAAPQATDNGGQYTATYPLERQRANMRAQPRRSHRHVIPEQ